MMERAVEVMEQSNRNVTVLSGRIFVAGCGVVGGALLLAGRTLVFPGVLLATEVAATILALFLFSSFRYRFHKNAISWGALIVIVATFCGLETSDWHLEVAQQGWGFWVQRHLFTFAGLEELVHADTMLFILGLTLFVASVARTHILEEVAFFLLKRNGGAVLPAVVVITAAVALASGVLDGVSLVGLMIRTLAVILLLAGASRRDTLMAVLMGTAVTTICGIWLAYGEPPNLIIKANLDPGLRGTFFLRYCAPAAIAAYAVVARRLRVLFRHARIHLDAAGMLAAENAVEEAPLAPPGIRHRLQMFAAAALVPFVALLVVHGITPRVPLFAASFAGFAVAFAGVGRIPGLRAEALKEAREEYAEYYFLFPLFMSVTLLGKAGLFDRAPALIQSGIGLFGRAHFAWLQFMGSTLVSAILNNNVVADVASRALRGLDTPSLHLFAMAQIAGYAVGGCWTHIGCTQSVVAYAFIQRNLDPGYTPLQWIRDVTPIVVEMLMVITAIIYAESALMGILR